MQKELASILKGKLVLLPFADLVAGLAQTLTTSEMTEDNATTIQARRPVSYDATRVNGDPCLGKEVALIPDSTSKSIIYFEDFGISATPRKGRLQGYNASLRLICWLDRSKLVGDGYAEIAGRCQAAIVSKICYKNPENIGMFTTLQVSVARIPPQDAALFGRYTYSETDRQYLRPPFEFFGIDLTCNYFVSDKCLNEIGWNVVACS